MLALLTIGCGGAEPLEEVPLSEWACSHIATGALVDVSAVRADAPAIEVGRVPYRVNVRPQEAGYLAFTHAEDADLVLLTDDASAVAAFWTDDGRTEVETLELDPSCTETPLFTAELTVAAGDGSLEVGPTRQASVWLALGSP